LKKLSPPPAIKSRVELGRVSKYKHTRKRRSRGRTYMVYFAVLSTGLPPISRLTSRELLALFGL
jgi:hypothetical protein